MTDGRKKDISLTISYISNPISRNACKISKKTWDLHIIYTGIYICERLCPISLLHVDQIQCSLILSAICNRMLHIIGTNPLSPNHQWYYFIALSRYEDPPTQFVKLPANWDARLVICQGSGGLDPLIPSQIILNLLWRQHRNYTQSRWQWDIYQTPQWRMEYGKNIFLVNFRVFFITSVSREWNM